MTKKSYKIWSLSNTKAKYSAPYSFYIEFRLDFSESPKSEKRKGHGAGEDRKR